MINFELMISANSLLHSVRERKASVLTFFCMREGRQGEDEDGGESTTEPRNLIQIEKGHLVAPKHTLVQERVSWQSQSSWLE